MSHAPLSLLPACPIASVRGLLTEIKGALVVNERKVWLLGELRVVEAGKQIDLPGAQLQQLFVYLALQPGVMVRRATVIEALWPEVEAHNNRRLTNTLYRLQKILGDGWLASDSDRLWLQAGADLWIDVVEAAQLAQTEDPAALHKATELYKGELAPEIQGTWILSRRQTVQNSYIALLNKLGRLAEHQQDFVRAIDYFKRMITVEPFEEAGYRGLMRALGRQKRYVAALQQFDQLQQLLTSELGVAPSPETLTLADTLRAEQRAWVTPADLVTPFVGRQRQRLLLLDRIEQLAAGRGGVVLLEGDAGIGKTRFLQTVAESARWRAIPLLWAAIHTPDQASTRLAPADQDPIYQALANYFAGTGDGATVDRATVDRAALVSLRQQLSPLAQQLLNQLTAARSALAASPTEWIAENRQAAWVELLLQLAAITPLVLICDDMHRASAALWTFISDLGAAIADRPLLLILSYQPRALQTEPLAWQKVRALELADAVSLQLHLPALEVGDFEQLLRRLGRQESSDECAQLHRLTRGNPLFLLQALHRNERGTRLLTDRIAQMLSDLPLALRQALQTSVILGPEISHSQWQALIGTDADTAAQKLIAAQLLDANEQGFRTTHELVPTVALGLLNAAQLRDLHRRAAQVLTQQAAPAARLAWHYAQAGQWREAVQNYRLAGDQARRAHDVSTALRHYEQALTLLTNHEHKRAVADLNYERFAIRLGRQKLLRQQARYGECALELLALEQMAETTDPALLLRVWYENLWLAFHTADGDEAAVIGAKALNLAQKLQDRATETLVHCLWASTLFVGERQSDEAFSHALLAIHLAEEANDKRLLVRAWTTLAHGYARTGDYLLAKEFALRALRLAETDAGLARYQHEIFLVLVDALWCLGELEMAWVFGQRLLQQPQVQADHYLLALAYFYVVGITASLGDSDLANELLAIWQQRTAAITDPADRTQVAVLAWVAQLRIAVCSGDLTTGEQLVQVNLSASEAGERHFASMAAIRFFWYNLALLRLEQARYSEVIDLCEAAMISARQRHDPERFLLPMSIAAAKLGDQPRSDYCREWLTLHFDEIAGGFRLWALYARSLLVPNRDTIASAYAELQRRAAEFTNERRRRQFLENLWLHRQIDQQWRTRQAEQSSAVKLARITVPLGRKVTESDLVAVQWTPDAGDTDAEFLQRHGKVALRQQRILRLLRQANQQGAAPTNNDLAAALQVSARTIDSDMIKLAALGELAQLQRRPR